ncbi:copper resistance protein CopC [Devosia sp. 2618]|uniref:copper resistance CopC/CopD family protein n=1 Tax=Devosia sp. 2618 TaxID=3156454 RepID=UPI003398A0A7
MRRAFTRYCLVAMLGLLLATLPAATAWAHAQLLSTDPTENAVLDAAPEALRLHFNEPVTALAIRLIDKDGVATDLLEQTTSGETVAVSVPDALADGTQVLSWRVVSTDGHPIAGSLIFSVGMVTGASVVATGTDQAVAVALWTGKLVLFIALFVGVGGAVFSAAATLPPAAHRTALVLSVIGIVVAPVTLGLQGLDALGLPLTSLFDLATWRAGLSTSYGNTAIAATLAFALAVLALAVRPSRTLAILAGLVAALSIALSGHASAANPQWLTRPAVFLHIAGLLFWIGALLPLWLLLRTQSADASRALANFSRAVPFAVAAIVVSGIALGIIQMGAPGPQWLSAYGIILAIKLGLLVILFALALWNRLSLTTPALAGEVKAQTRLRQSIGVELALVLIILALVAGWRFTPPPRALAVVVEAAEPIYGHVMDDEHMAMLTITPGQAGPTIIEIILTDFEGELLTPLSVDVTFSQPDLGIEPFTRPAVESEGLWLIQDLTIPVPGTWLVDLNIRASRFELFKMEGEVDVP